jgi:hypothetical protein
MKMVKSLLLGSAAGLVAVTAGQAADLPVKAKPVEYVKICSLYGAGFFYMPGTDLCLKVGGFARFENAYNTNGQQSGTPFNGMTNQRTTNNDVFRARGYITADAREQSAYGTIRGYLAVGLSTTDVGLTNAANTFSANRAFVQFAGFTAGISQSFYDFYSAAAVAYLAGAHPSEDTGDGGWMVSAYTAQFGNGFTGTLSYESRRTTQIIDGNCVATGPSGTAGAGTPTCGSVAGGGSYPTAASAASDQIAGGAGIFPGNGAYGGMQMGDVVANLRLDQAWGGGQIMGALHEVNASYYGTGAASAPTVIGGHPGDAWGWVGGVGLRLNAPMIGTGDYFQGEFDYTNGAVRYLFNGQNNNWGLARGASEAFGVISDGVYGGTAATGTSVQLTTAYGFNASFEHHWTPAWQQSLYGGMDWVRYNDTANNLLCAGASGATVTGTGSGTGAKATPGCSNDWSVWWVGSRLQWNVTKTFYMGVDVMYENMTSATLPGNIVASTSYAFGGATHVANEGDWMFRVRAHRDFLP